MPIFLKSKGSLNYHTLAVAITFISLLFAAIALFLAPQQSLLPGPSYIITYSTFDSTPQRLAHKVLLCSMAVLGLLSPWLRTMLGAMIGSAGVSALNCSAAKMRRLPIVVMVLLVPLFLWLYQGVGRDQYLLGMILFAGVLLFSRAAAENARLRFLCGAILALCLLWFLLPGFWGAYCFGPGLEAGLMHYYGLFGIVPLLAKGGDILANSRVFYGVLPQTLLAIPQRLYGLLQMNDYVLLVQISQVAFTLVGIASYRLLAPKGVIRILFCLGLWLPWISTAGGSITAPTSSGFRFMNFPVAVLVLLCIERWPRFAQALTLGATAGFALLYNLETGICVTLAFIAHSVIAERPKDVGAMAQRLLFLLLGALASLGGFALLFRLGLGRWPLVSAERLFSFIGQFSSGFAGLPLHFDLMAILLLLYPAYLLARLTGVWLDGRLSEKMRFKFLVSFIIMVWMGYYFNRPHHWNLWSHTFLFTFLIIDQLPQPMQLWQDRKDLLSLGRKRVPVMTFALIFILGPAFMNTGLSESKTVWRSTAQRLALARNSSGMERLSGIWLDAPCAQDIRERSSYLVDAAKRERVVFVSANQFLLQLHTGVFFPLPVQDLLTESFSAVDFSNNVAELKKDAPDVVLLDSAGACQNSFSEREPFRQALRAALQPDYQSAGMASGWHVLTRATPSAEQ